MNKKLLSAFAAAAATISTPALAADAYTLEDNNGYTVSVMEMTQTEMRDIIEPIMDSQEQKPGMTLEEVRKQRAFYNAYIREEVIKIARDLGYNEHRSRSFGMGLSRLGGRFYLRADASLSYDSTEFNPNVSTPINGFSPSAITSFSRASDGTGIRSCGILMSDEGFDAAEWYNDFTGENVQSNALPAGYSEYFRENAQWVERTNCFFVDGKVQSEYFGARQLLNAHYGQDDMEAVIEFVNFYADTYARAVENGYMKGEDLHLVSAAIRAAVDDFQKQDAKLDQKDIWTMISDKAAPSTSRLQSLFDKHEDEASARQELFVTENTAPVIDAPATTIKVSFSGM